MRHARRALRPRRPLKGVETKRVNLGEAASAAILVAPVRELFPGVERPRVGGLEAEIQVGDPPRLHVEGAALLLEKIDVEGSALTVT